jgi:signal peptidase I
MTEITRTEAEAKPNTAKRRRVSFVRWTISIILLVPLVIAWAAFLRGDLQSYKVISRSMQPTLMVGECFLMVRESRYENLRDKIVVFTSADEYHQALVKRVIAADNDEVELKGGILYINGKQESPLREPISYVGNRKWSVPKGSVFVVGDNRNLSEDSIDHGPIPRKQLRGVLVFRYWPLSQLGFI